MDTKITGIHHVTAIAGDPQRNIDFYAGLLGLRFVKRTVNFDDPGTYHFYYGDHNGSPGTILTFFSWPGAARGRRGTGQATSVGFAIPETARGYWAERLRQQDVIVEGPTTRGDEQVLSFTDPDGLALELIAVPDIESRPGWEGSTVPAEQTVRNIHSITLSLEGIEQTASLLTETLGFRKIHEEENRFRYEAGEGGSGTRVDLLCRPDAPFGRVASGTIHHIAWRTPNEGQQEQWRRELARLGYNVSPVMDRQYFHSIYFREPGGVLFEIATDPPGFATDETPEQLGSGLKLPPWLEPHRQEIEGVLPPIHLPAVSRGNA